MEFGIAMSLLHDTVADAKQAEAYGFDYLSTGACPAAPAMQLQSGEDAGARLRPEDFRGPPWREFAGAY